MSALTAYKFPLKKVDITEEKDGRDVKIGDLDYAHQYRLIVTTPSNREGMSADETIKAMDALAPIKEAKKDNKEFALLDKDSHDFFISKLNAFRFGMAHEVVYAFVKECRDMAKVELTPAAESAKKKP
jgi:hypothetical protein